MAVRFSRWIVVVTVVSVGGVLVAALVGDPEVSPGDGRSPAATGSLVAPRPDGALLYAEHCAACHDTDRGPGDMPSFGDELTEEQIIAVVEFTRSDG